MSEFTKWLKNRDQEMYSEMAAMLGGDDPLAVHHREMGAAKEAENNKIHSELIKTSIPDVIEKMNKIIDTENVRLYTIDFELGSVENLEQNIQWLQPGNVKRMIENPGEVQRLVTYVNNFLDRLQSGSLSGFAGGGEVARNKTNGLYLNSLKSKVLNPLNLAYKALLAYKNYQP